MMLDEQAVARLHELQRTSIQADALSAAEVTGMLKELLALAAATPAWVERYVEIAGRLLERSGRDAQQPHAVEQVARLHALSDDCAQVVGADTDLTFTRAEWVDDSLLLTLRFASPDPERRTMFRIVRAEPRMWYLTGIEGATNEVTQQSVIVWLPCVDGVLEFVPGSY